MTMPRKSRLAVLILLAVLMLTVSVSAQNSTPTPPPNPNANITWPPPVYVVRGQFTVRGSANLPNMTGYFLEYETLNANLSAPTPELWLPATLPNASAVQDGELGVWNTTAVPDGIYNLRLTINVQNSTPVQVVVGPLRVENTPSPFAATATPFVPTAVPTQILPTLPPTPTAFDPTPRATAALNANVRSGDGTNYPVIAGLTQGESVPIVGVSSLGTGWYLVQLANGTRGWVAPTVVTVTGNIGSVPLIQPPPPPVPTAIPATATPVSNVNLVAGNYSFDPPSPKCNQTFNIYIDVANFGTQANGSGVIGIQDFRNADNSLQGSTIGAIPSIAPGATVKVGPIPLTISTFYNEQHRLVISLDPSNLIPETNKTDNVKVALYTLEKAACP